MSLLKKTFGGLFFACILFFMTACGKSEQVVDYVDVSFEGMDTLGNATFEVDETKLLQEIFNLEDDAHDFPDEKTAKQAQNVLEAYEITVEPQEGLSNGDKVKIVATVDEDLTTKIEGGEKEITVEGLEEPVVLTTEEVEESLVFNFNGVSGRGVAQIDKVFDESFLNDLTFEVENDGNLSNGDNVDILVGENIEDELHANGYILDENFKPSVEVKGLDELAETATDIKNLEDIERFLEEELNEKYYDTDYSFGSNRTYEITREKLMYRQFDKETDEEHYYEDDQHGSLVGIFSVEKYEVDDDDKELTKEFTLIFGYYDIILDEDGNANLSEIKQISEEKEDNYSLESVIQLYEGLGYEEVKK